MNETYPDLCVSLNAGYRRLPSPAGVMTVTEVEHFPEPCAARGHGPVWCAECMERWPCPSVLAGWCCARCKKAPEQHALGREAEVCVYEPAVVVPPGQAAPR